MQQLDKFHGAAAFALALALTLVLAAYLTPRNWWRRPNARALAILAGGTWGLGSLILWLAHGLPPALPGLAATAALAAAAQTPAAQVNPGAPKGGPLGEPFRVHHDLNLRAGAGTDAARIAIVRSGSMVTPTGAREGDWWQVKARVAGREMNGWASSLWLRLPSEEAQAPSR
ncbi:MAG TPA: SH3 domain-containing protein [Janthinobacterium sp.]|nr:SH3 domain-containing protein [Janthinobacterium sp.]